MARTSVADLGGDERKVLLERLDRRDEVIERVGGLDDCVREHLLRCVEDAHRLVVGVRALIVTTPRLRHERNRTLTSLSSRSRKRRVEIREQVRLR